MSTKIYYARRFPLDKLAEFMLFTRPEMFERIAVEVRKCMDAVTEEYIQKKFKEFDEREKEVTESRRKAVEDTWRYMKAEEIFRHRRPEKKGDDGRPFLNLDCGWNIYLYEGLCYAYVWGWDKLHHDIEYPEWAEDFCYWNNTDPPEGMREGAGYDQWQERGRLWHEILDCKTEYARRVQYVVFDTTFSHSHISLTEMQSFLKVGWFSKEAK